LFLRLGLDLADAPVGVLADLVLDLLEQDRLRLRGGHRRDALELLADLLLRLGQLTPGPLELLLALAERALPTLDLLDAAVELLFLLLDASLLALDVAAPLAEVLFGFAADLERFVARFQEQLALARFRFLHPALGR